MRQAVKNTWARIVPEVTRRNLYHLRKQVLRRDASLVERISTPLVSVVVPVYLVEDYLIPCVHSILGQTYKNLEVILVDDGSPDGSGDLCDELASQHKRVSVIHKPNGGLSDARNCGLREATGEFIMFVDSDDILPRDAIASLVDGIGDADVATGDVNRFRGKRVWQSWNQLYSHARSTTWDDKPVAPVLTSLKLADAPELLFDTTAWNKLFRRSFLDDAGIEFPKGKLYEDMLPMAQAFLAADSIVKVPSTVYLYREREDRSSITQKRGQLKNLADKMEMVGRIESELIAADAGASALDTLYFKVLEGDLPVYSPYLGSDTKFDEIYLRELRKYWNLATTEAKERLTLQRRVLFLNQLYASDYLDGEREAAWVAENLAEIPRVADAGRVKVDSDFAPEHLGILADHGLLDSSKHVDLRYSVVESYIHDGVLRISGYAFLDGIPNEIPQKIALRLKGDDGYNQVLDVEYAWDRMVNTFWSSGMFDHSSLHFNASAPLVKLAGAITEDFVERAWRIELNVTAGDYSETRTISTAWRGGRIRLGEVAEVSPGFTARMPWHPAQAPLRLLVRRDQYVARDAKVEGGKIHVLVEGTSDETSLDAVRTWDGLRLDMEPQSSINGAVAGGTWYVGELASVPRRERSGGNANEWRLEAQGSADVSAVRVTSGSLFSSGIDMGEGWATRSNSDSTALLFDSVSTLQVENIIATDGGYVLTGRGDLTGYEDFKVDCWNARGMRYSGFQVRVGFDGTFAIHIDCTIPGDEEAMSRAWEPGEYRMELKQTGVRGCRYRIRASRELVRDFPMETITPVFRGRWHVISDTWEMALGIFAPLGETERGRYNELELQRRWKAISDAEIEPLDAVVFSVNMGGSAGDSQLALFKEMVKREIPWRFYWGVSDRSKWVPQGATPVVRGTEEWFELLNRARLVVNNYGGILGYGDRAFQRYLQTWHGTPLKVIGDSEFAMDARAYAQKKLRAQSEAEQWDWFVSPSPVMTELIPHEFYYSGAILETGYPRNDALAACTAEDRGKAKKNLGIPPDSKVILYAPTFRDSMTDGYSSPLVDFLDLERLVNDLGEGWFILLRGHSFNLRAQTKDHSSARVLDVTSAHDLNELIVASDMLVTDYSSIMFDYLNTGKPIIYFAPDLEGYLANREMYFDYGDVLAGQLVQTQTDLVKAIQGAMHLGCRAGERERYQSQRRRFAPWDDGMASGRVIDEIGSEFDWPRIAGEES